LQASEKGSHLSARRALPAAAAGGRVRGDGPKDVEPHHDWTYWTKRGENSDARHEIRILSAILTFAFQIWAVSGDRPNLCRKLGLLGEQSRHRYVTDEEFLEVRAFAPPMVASALDLDFMCGISHRI
jgi:hypothetical protein